ncbi:membrane protein [Acinetobacter sp. C15]|uniref:DUF1634 domain-containing protein n=1 Tax=Acinetobacter soli NIPH 2899 TaxID=1217677 RepID=A0ABP2U662_9GAMM|nr:hypothetical protein F950_02809 [Acinetobacter soli NIPH 2899]KOR15297.1 membrane protein [Acinetobacter sp. C15]
MIDLIAFLLILLGMFLLYVVSTKQIEKTKKSRFHLLPRSASITRCIAWLCFLTACGSLTYIYGNSIGIVSWFIFATPLVFLLICTVNDLKTKAK